MGCEHSSHSVKRPIGIVLMINCVEFGALNELQQVRNFDRNQARRPGQVRKTGDKIIQGRNVREHVVGNYKGSVSTLGHNVLRDRKPEECDLGWHASSTSSRSHIVGRFYSQAAYIGRGKIFEEVSVIAGY